MDISGYRKGKIVSFNKLRKNGITSNTLPRDRGDYNCWGFTAYVFGWKNYTDWVDHFDMEKLLLRNSNKIDEEDVEIGDIVVFRDENKSLCHTAVVTDNEKRGKKIIHKIGAGYLIVTNIDMTYKIYNELDKSKMEYRRNVKWEQIIRL